MGEPSHFFQSLKIVEVMKICKMFLSKIIFCHEIFNAVRRTLAMTNTDKVGVPHTQSQARQHILLLLLLLLVSTTLLLLRFVQYINQRRRRRAHMWRWRRRWRLRQHRRTLRAQQMDWRAMFHLFLLHTLSIVRQGSTQHRFIANVPVPPFVADTVLWCSPASLRHSHPSKLVLAIVF